MSFSSDEEENVVDDVVSKILKKCIRKDTENTEIPLPFQMDSYTSDNGISNTSTPAPVKKQKVKKEPTERKGQCYMMMIRFVSHIMYKVNKTVISCKLLF